MNVSFFQALANLNLAISNRVAALSPAQASAALNELRRVPSLHGLQSLQELSSTERLTGLLFHQDRYDAVAERLAMPPETLRGIFGAETRADRLLPAVTEPNLWIHRESLKFVSNSFAAGAEAAVADWKRANVRRLFPRASSPILMWTAQRSALLGSTRLIVESFSTIEEHREGVENYAAQFQFKMVDWEGRYLGRGGSPKALKSRLRGLSASRESFFESRFEGKIPGTEYDWKAWLVMRNFSFLTRSAVFHRKDPKELETFFAAAHRAALRIVSDILSIGEI